MERLTPTEKHKYKVGSKVKIRYMDPDKYSEPMVDCGGDIATITDIINSQGNIQYRVKENYYYWDEEMLEPVKKENKDISRDLIKDNNFMNNADKQYLTLVKDILDHGYYDQNRTGVATYKLPHKIFQFDLSKGEFPILTTKFVAFKTAVKELLWIFKDQSNDVIRLQNQNVHIWDEWMLEDGTIGRAYGYQVRKHNQIDDLIRNLKNNPQDRRMIINLWNNADLKYMALQPCCFLTMWDVTDGRLNCMLVQRSGDVPLGVPFNMSQYAVLVHLIAQVTGLKPGLFTHVINNAHIYENQVEGMKLQLTREDKTYKAPKLWINPEITNFYDFTPDDIKLIGYEHHPSIKMEVSV